MFDDNKSHKILLLGIGASLSFTVFVAGWFGIGLSEVANDVDTLLEDVGYIKGVLSQWSSHQPGQ